MAYQLSMGRLQIPGLVEKKVPLTAEDIKDVENISGKAYEVIGVDRNLAYLCQHTVRYFTFFSTTEWHPGQSL